MKEQIFFTRSIPCSVIVNPWFFLPVEVLQGLTFGLFYATMATYASEVAIPGTEASVQAIVGASFEGLGESLYYYASPSGSSEY